jgi:hypothetical protein
MNNDINDINVLKLFEKINNSQIVKSKYKKIIFKLIKKNSIIVNKFYIMTINNKLINIFLLFTSYYYKISLKESLYLGIDLEFYNNIIKLIQLSFYLDDINVIIVYNPNMLNDIQNNILIHNLYTSNIYKILHGGDSCDIPYIYNNLLNKNKEHIIKFTSFLFDTLFLCQYYKIYTLHENNKCSLYDSLLFFKTIKQKKYNYLEKLNKSIGKIYKIKWNISQLTTNELKYALYDVLYLKKLLKQIFYHSTNYDEYLTQQLNIIVHLTRFVYLEKSNLFTMLSIMKKYISNNNTNNMLKIIDAIIIDNINLKIIDIMKINYFKSTIKILLVYVFLFTHHEKSNNATIPNIKIYYNTFRQLNLGNIVVLLERFYNQSKIEIKICENKNISYL